MDNIIPEYEVKELPSRFIGYPEEVKIYATPHSFGSALNIEMVGKNNINTMSETLEGIKVVGMAKNMLTPQDILFLGVYRNLLSSKHDKIDIRSYCPKCLNENHEKKSLSDIKFKAIEDFNRDVYPIEVSFNDYTMWFTFLSYKDFDFCMRKYRGHKLTQLAFQVCKYVDKNSGETFEKPEYSSNTKNTTATKLIEEYVSKLKGILYSFVDEDKETLEEVVNILEDYGLKPVEVHCKDEHCKNVYSVELDGEGILITPFRDTEVSPRDRIKLHKNNFDGSNISEENEFERSGDASRLDTKTSTRKKKQDLNDQIHIY